MLAPPRMTVLNPHTPAGDKVGKTAAEALPQQLAWWDGGAGALAGLTQGFFILVLCIKIKNLQVFIVSLLSNSSLGNVAYVRNNKYGQSFLFKNSHHGHIFRALK